VKKFTLTKRNLSRLFMFSFLCAVAASMILPLLFMVLTTFKTRAEFLGNMFALPKQINFDNYRLLWHDFNFFRLAFNSLIISFCSVILSLWLTSMSGYSLARIPFFGRKVFIMFILLGMFMPGQVLILPVYSILINLNLVNSYWGLMLFYVGSSTSFTTLMIMANVKKIPHEILESAKVDGANQWQTYLYIVLPMLRPILATVAILNFIGYWNELLYALILLQDPELRTLTSSIVSVVNKFGSNPPVLYAGLLISALPVIILYFALQKHLIKGVGAGAVK
jgi:raffinose/stachyose/melibiose transport system permease protein